MIKAIWNGKIIAESEDVIKIFGTFYFPANSVNQEYLHRSNTRTISFWNGIASYYSIVVDGKENHDAAWFYEDAGEIIENMKDRIAFWKDVRITFS